MRKHSVLVLDTNALISAFLVKQILLPLIHESVIDDNLMLFFA